MTFWLDRVSLSQGMNSKISYILLPNLSAFPLHCPAWLDLDLTCRSLVPLEFDIEFLLLDNSVWQVAWPA